MDPPRERRREVICFPARDFEGTTIIDYEGLRGPLVSLSLVKTAILYVFSSTKTTLETEKKRLMPSVRQ
jgi:hypothetical protein